MNSIVDSNGEIRFFGNLVPPADRTAKVFLTYGDTADTPLIPRDKWKDYAHTSIPDNLTWLPPAHNQANVGMCNASATAAAMEAQRAKQGLPYVKLSGGDLYGRINGGQDQGSLLEDGLEAAMSEGIASVNTCPYLDWRKRSPEQVAERKKYKTLEAFICPKFDHCFSAVAMGFSLISGIMWYESYTPTADGWLPNARGQAGGHAVFGFLPMVRGNQFGILHLNSWGNWGYQNRGLCVFPEESYRGPVGGWWAVRSVTDEGNVVPQETK